MAVSKTIEIFEKKNMISHVQEIGAYLAEQLERLVQEKDCVIARKGKGLIQGIEISKPVGEVMNAALKEGLLVISARGNVIRLVPPLVIEKQHVDEMIDKLSKVL